MTQTLPYLIERGGLYYVRLIVPKALRGRFIVSELRWSLRTTEGLRAGIIALQAKETFERFCKMVRRMPSMRRDEIAKWLRGFRASLEVLSITPEDDNEDVDEWALGQESMAEEAAEGYRRQARCREFTSEIERAAETVAKAKGVKPADMGRDDWLMLRAGVARAFADQADEQRFRLRQPASAYRTADELFQLPLALASVDAPSATVAVKAPPNPTPPKTVASLMEKYLAFKTSGKSPWKPRTLEEHKRIFGWLRSLFGEETPTSALTKDSMIEFRDRLETMKRGTKAAAPVASWHTYDPNARMSGKTLKKYYGYVQALLSWGFSENHVPNKFWDGVKLSNTSSDPNKKRRGFTDTELKQVFATPLFAGCGSKGCKPSDRSASGDIKTSDGLFWMPIVASLTGAREAEILQLRKIDIGNEEGIAYLDFNSLDGKTLKTHSSHRKLPIHPRLVDLGLLEYVETVCAKGKDWLFADVRSQTTLANPEAYYSKWWGRYMDLVGMTDPTLVFHSFRHTLATKLRKKSAPDHILEAIEGHSPKTQTSKYGAYADLPILSQWINKIDAVWLDPLGK